MQTLERPSQVNPLAQSMHERYYRHDMHQKNKTNST
jgi:hypothetical protein